MPAFVAISGAIYALMKREKHKYKVEITFIKNKAKRLLIPFYFFAAATVLPVVHFLIKTNNSTAFYIFKNIIVGVDPRHLWYLMMIFLLFVFFNHFEKNFF